MAVRFAVLTALVKREVQDDETEKVFESQRVTHQAKYFAWSSLAKIRNLEGNLPMK